MSSTSTNNLSYDEGIEANEDLDSPNELEGQPESGYNSAGPIMHQNIPTQQLPGNNIVPFQNGVINNAIGSVAGRFITVTFEYNPIPLAVNNFTGLISSVGAPLILGISSNNRHKHKLPLKRLGRVLRSTSGMAAGIKYSKIGKNDHYLFLLLQRYDKKRI